MLNIFVTYRCNLSCPYCFACELQKDFKEDMQQQEFNKLLTWLQDSKTTTVAFIGGEPTLHPNISTMVRQTAEAGIAVTLFTNGLFSPELLPQLTPYVANFVINFNDPKIYPSTHQYNLLHENLKNLTTVNARVTFSKNFAPGNTDYGYLLEGARQYHIKAIRYDISRPSNNGTNTHYAISETAKILEHIVEFVRDCEAYDIKTGLDCCLKYCELSVDTRRYLERVSMKLTGICHPSVDIHPDLSASYCLPMRHVTVDDVTTFRTNEQLTRHFAAAVRPIRFKNVSQQCESCSDFKIRCQGGCLALKESTTSLGVCPEPN
jgi:pyruvate-formate lyase-activating enzyme